MEHKQKLLGYYNYTVILTYLGVLSGFLGIVSVLEGKLYTAVLCLMFAGLCDMFDGTVASTLDRTEPEKCFGIQIDSLSDLVCFGVLPGLIVYKMNQGSVMALGISGLYVLCALIRLAYFNVDEQERQKNSTAGRKIYYGMPVTLSAILIPLIIGIGIFFDWSSNRGISYFLLVMAALFLLPFQLRKPGSAGKVCMLVFGVAEAVFVIWICKGVR